MRKGVKKASLEYETQKTLTDGDKKYSLVKIKLHTGRTHQIRVQFSSRKMPLLGDGKYGGKCEGCKTALWSYSLSFLHPFTGKEIFVNEPAPNVYPWNMF